MTRYDDHQALMTRLFETGALLAGLETDLLKAVAEGGGSAVEIGARAQVDPSAAAAVLEVLATMGFVERVDAGYRSGPLLAALTALPDGGLERVGALRAGFVAFLRSGARLGRMNGSPEERAAEYRRTVRWLSDTFAEPAHRLAAALTEMGLAGREILDVGAGAGIWSLALALRDPEARVTALDLEGVLPVFAAHAEELGLGPRVRTLAGDYRSVELGAGTYDLAVLANVLHLEPEEEAEALVQRIGAAVAPAGTLVLVDALDGASQEGARELDAYRLSLAMRTRGGRPHASELLRRWLAEAGFGGVETLRWSPGSGFGALVARRTEAPSPRAG